MIMDPLTAASDHSPQTHKRQAVYVNRLIPLGGIPKSITEAYDLRQISGTEAPNQALDDAFAATGRLGDSMARLFDSPQSFAPLQPVKRPRGRPRKNPIVSYQPTYSFQPLAATPATPAKRGPGRPRKNPIVPYQPAYSSQLLAATPATPAKRGPGRPRKNPIVAYQPNSAVKPVVAAPAMSAKRDSIVSEQPAEQIQATPVTPGRRPRGRPPKTPTVVEQPTEQTAVVPAKTGTPDTITKPNLKRTASESEHFRSPRKRQATATSVIEFPRLKSPIFGLIQEELASNPFHMLVAVLFLAKTKGSASIPVTRKIIAQYPTPESLAAAEPEDLFPDIQHLGLGSIRAQALIELAEAWIERPPEKDKRYKRLNYPSKGDGKNITPREEPLSDDDPREAYEVAQLPHIGPYGIDSWRIFCRDDLRGVPSGVKKKSLKRKPKALNQELQQEWTRVMPADKELRAYLRWRWLRLGVDWNPDTGEKRDVDMSILKKMQKQKIGEHDGLVNPWKAK